MIPSRTIRSHRFWVVAATSSRARSRSCGSSTAFISSGGVGASSCWSSTTTAGRITRRIINNNNVRWLATTTLNVASNKKKSTATDNDDYHLVIAESPYKCKTLSKILNDNNEQFHDEKKYYKVAACLGHVRNLPRKNKKKGTKKKSKTKEKESSSSNDNHDDNKFPYSIPGIDLNNNYKPTYEMLPEKVQIVKELNDLASKAKSIILATDPDREGEGIAWHLTQVLLPGSTAEKQKPQYSRWRLQEITPTAVKEAIQLQQQQSDSNKYLNDALVEAQETRRILDRLVGFTVSPALLKLLKVALSAGRVQSVALAIIVNRELERLKFVPTSYCGIQAKLQTPDTDNNQNITATLKSVNGQIVALNGRDFKPTGQGLTDTSSNKLHLQQEQANELVQEFLNENTSWKVLKVESRRVVQKPPQPFRTSTLQQIASNGLGMSVNQCMSIAQQLYQNGYISYMRTDATNLSNEAITAIRNEITSQYGKEYVNTNNANNDEKSSSSKSKKNKKKGIKFAQEAHEAIRPALQENEGGFATPQQLKSELSPAQSSLYNVIYKRTLSSLMTSQVSNSTRVIIQGTTKNNNDNDSDDDETATISDNTITLEFTVTGRVVLHDGYTAVWKDLDDDSSNNNNDNGNQVLPPLTPGQVLDLQDLVSLHHETQPPPRYNEASIVRTLEELGVGRPSTYASTIQILRDRAYVVSPNTNNNRRSSSSTAERKGSALVAQRAATGGAMELTGATSRGPLVPSLPAFCVTSLLQQHCPVLVDPEFTARMEERLDEIANRDDDDDDESGDVDVDDADADADDNISFRYLDDFYAGPEGLAAQVKLLQDTVPSDTARRVTLPALQERGEENDDVGLFIGPWGPYVTSTTSSSENNGGNSAKPLSASLPPHMAANLSLITPGALKALLSAKKDGGVVLGQHPEDGRNIRLKTGRYGAFLQWGDDDQTNTTTHSLPKGKIAGDLATYVNEENSDDDDSITMKHNCCSVLGISLEEAIGYVGLPRTVSTLHGRPVVAAIGPYGPYLKYNNSYVSLREVDVLDVDTETANRLVTEEIIEGKRKTSQRGVLATLGEKEGSPVTVKKGRFGDYINWKKVNAKLPPQYSDEPISTPLDEAWALIQEKADKNLSPKGRKKKSTKASSVNDDNTHLPPAPKRPLSAYIHFCMEKRPEVSAAGATLGETSKALAALWAKTTANERERYEEMAIAGKEEYQAKKIAWEKECQALQGESRAATSSSRSKKTTKARSPSAYILFCRDYRPTIVDGDGNKLPFGETTKKLAALWKECDDETRTKFDKQAEEEKEKLLKTT